MSPSNPMECGHSPAPGPAQVRVLYLWMPEHSMHSRTPRLMEAQPGSEWPQSQHWPLPGRPWILCRMVSPRSRRSRGSLAESMLLVDGEAVLSRRWDGREKSFINLSWMYFVNLLLMSFCNPLIMHYCILTFNKCTLLSFNKCTLLFFNKCTLSSFNNVPYYSLINVLH